MVMMTRRCERREWHGRITSWASPCYNRSSAPHLFRSKGATRRLRHRISGGDVTIFNIKWRHGTTFGSNVFHAAFRVTRDYVLTALLKVFQKDVTHRSASDSKLTSPPEGLSRSTNKETKLSIQIKQLIRK